MKATFLTAICFLVITSLSSQQNSSAPVKQGFIVYNEIVKLDIKLEGDAAQFAHMLPKERTSSKALYFNDEFALYKKYDAPRQDDAGPEIVETEGMMVQVKMMEPDNKTFTYLKNNKQIEQREFMTRMFLVERKLTVPNWKFTGNNKSIIGYNCMEATCEDKEGKTLTAWFTPEIPLPAGPDTIGNLPGMVLAVDYDNGQRTINAIEIDTNPLDADILKKPKKGKKVSEQKYKAIVQEKMEEMGAEGGQGGSIQTVIKIGQ